MNQTRNLFNVSEKSLSNLLFDYYIPYSVETIKARALPYIDGFKPVAKKTLWTMYESGVYDTSAKRCRRKSARIVGDCMGKYHPHGDSSIYENLCTMTDEYDGMNEPLIIGQGTFGAAWSGTKNRTVKAAHMRYTEAKLAPIALELFDGVKENAVPMVENFDGTEKEPAVLPTKFPNVIVNTASGIAVSMSSNIPSYNLKNACEAVIAMLDGTATSPEDLIDILGAPDFPYGGHIHASREQILNLIKTGRGTLEMTGLFHSEGDSLVIDEVPYNTCYEKFMIEVKELIKSGEEQDIKEVQNLIGDNSRGVGLVLRRGANMKEVALRLCQKTSLRKKISFYTRIIWKNQPKAMGIYELLEHWIEFRMGCVRRTSKVRHDNLWNKRHKLQGLVKIGNCIDEFVAYLRSHNSIGIIPSLQEKFDLTETQARFLAEMRITSICPDSVEKAEKDLKGLNEEIDRLHNLIFDDSCVKLFIIEQLKEIIAKYGKDRVTAQLDAVNESERAKPGKPTVVSEPVKVYMTAKGLVKALRKNQNGTFPIPPSISDNDEFICEGLRCNTKDKLLVFTDSGVCYKVPINQIEGSRGSMKQDVWSIVERKELGKLIYADTSANENGHFIVVYGNGKGAIENLSKYAGPRAIVKTTYKPADEVGGRMFVSNTDKFFIITRKRKAAYEDLGYLRSTGYASQSFKIATISKDDYVLGIQPLSKVPDLSKIDLDRYKKPYAVTIGSDVLWGESNKSEVSSDSENDRLYEDPEESYSSPVDEDAPSMLDIFKKACGGTETFNPDYYCGDDDINEDDEVIEE